MANQRRPRKKRKTAWCVAMIVLLVGVSWFGAFRWSVSRRLAKQIAVLESQGYPVTLDQLNDWYRLPDGADNAADRLKYQKFPKDLATLVPEYMAVVPVDPFDKEPIHYVMQKKGFIVYSVGEDGQDNGGRERDPNDRSKPFDLVCSVQSRD